MQKKSIQVRDYRENDRALLALCLDTMQDQMEALDPWRRAIRGTGHSARFVPELLRKVRRYHGFVLVAEVDGAGAGVAVAWHQPISMAERTTSRPTRVGYLADLAVLPTRRGHGVGTRLIRETERRLRRSDCDQMILGVFSPNIQAQRLYLREGFMVRAMMMAKQLGRPRERWPPESSPGRQSRTVRRRAPRPGSARRS